MPNDLLPIRAIADKLSLPQEMMEQLGPYGAKVKLSLRQDASHPSRGKLILVTATTPTASGEGKTVTAIGLAQGLERIGKRALIASREPSLGPVFGMKGGAAGGGRARVEPADKINLHFHGDFHAITSAHNLLAALIDSHLFHGNHLDLDPEAITWPRALDINDRALRRITVQAGGAREGHDRRTGFLITAASEVMAILALASGREDLRQRLARIVIGASRSGAPVRAAQLHATGPMMALLADALLPNLVQTTEGTPALVHCGPFANIAHGTSSILAQSMGLQLADYVVNECGFASDLGLEKYMDIVMPTSGIRPSVAVVVTTLKSLVSQGEGSLERGLANLGKHIRIARGFGLPVVAALNQFADDPAAGLETIRGFCARQRVGFALSQAYSKGGEGAMALAEEVVRTIEANPQPKVTGVYQPGDLAEVKIDKVARNVYGAEGVEFSPAAKASLARFARWGYATLPVCIAKTQYSLSDDPKLAGAPEGWTLHVDDISLSAGAGFLVAVAGGMMLMPGLPKESRAAEIDLDDEGRLLGVS